MITHLNPMECVRYFDLQNLYLILMDDFSASKFPKSLFLTTEIIMQIQMVKNYWEKRMKKELEEEQSKLEEEIKIAVKKKLDSIKESES